MIIEAFFIRDHQRKAQFHFGWPLFSHYGVMPMLTLAGSWSIQRTWFFNFLLMIWDKKLPAKVNMGITP
jgi:hypothetical protein